MDELDEKILNAKERLRKKLLDLDLQNIGITEYNQRYLGAKLKNIDGKLDLYGHLLTICLSDLTSSIDNYTFVDYGGGSGVLSYLAKEIGIGTVIYIDIYDGSCNDVIQISTALNLPLNHIITGDVDDLVSYIQKNSLFVDAIASYDVLEHIYDLNDHFKKLTLLKQGYKIVYASGANIKNPLSVRELQKHHMIAEYENREKIFGSKERDALRAYYDIRKDIIQSYCTELNDDEIKYLAKITRGLIESDIKACIDEYKQNGFVTYLNNHPTNTCDPYTGNWAEHLIEIEWLYDLLKELNYSVEIKGGFYHKPKSLTKQIIAQSINLFIHLLGKNNLIFSPYIIVIADHYYNQ